MRTTTIDERRDHNPRVWTLRPKKLPVRMAGVYGALVAFCWLYYYRPEDFIPGLTAIPMAKITGIFALLALLLGLMSSGKFEMPRAIKFLWLLQFQMTLCIPFAIWRGGAFNTVLERFSKAVIVAMLVSIAVVTLRQLRRLLWISVSAVALVTTLSILLRHHNQDGRLQGIQKSILENPNDLAMNIAISFPLAVVFLLQAKGFKKLPWAVLIVFMCLGIVLTDSRSGLLAFILSLIVCVWQYGIVEKRRSVVVVTVATFVLGMGIALSTGHYRARVESILMGNIAGSGDGGSWEARKALLVKSLSVAATHPLFGIGPSCFPILDSGWYVAHNTYTEIAAEAGIPALVLFLLTIAAAFKNLRAVRHSQLYKDNREFRVFTQGLWTAVAAYGLGACFASTEYNLYPYFLVGYTCAMVRIANQPGESGRERQALRLSKVTAWRPEQPRSRVEGRPLKT